MCHIKSMKNEPLQRQGAFLLNETAAKDAAVQMAMVSYMQTLQREHQQRQAVREGRMAPAAPTTVWNISDRH
jgi:hypothetical protein